jgi:hypothetical protein
MLGLVLLSSSPFVQALEIHHLFAEVDHDEHQHSDADLCQWIQNHTANSPIGDASHLSPLSVIAGFFLPDKDQNIPSLTLPLRHPRGPPFLPVF